jgi:hypothetical protein
MAEAQEDPTLAALRAIDEAEQAAAATEPGAWEYLGNRAVKGATGFLGVPGDLIDLARSGVNRVSRALTGVGSELGGGIPTDRVIATSDTYRRAAETAGIYDRNMTTNKPALRYAGGVAEMTGAGGPMALAKGAALPVITGSVGSGLGMEAGGDLAAGIGLNRQVGEAVGAFAGGLGPAMISNAGGAAVGHLRSRLSPAANRARADAAIQNEIARNLESYPQAQVNLQRSLQVSDDMAKAGASFTPSLPARTGAPGLLAAEKQLVTQNPTVLNTAVQNIQKNEDEIRKFLNTTFTEGGPLTTPQRVAKLQRTAAATLEQLRTSIDDRLDQVAQVIERNPKNFEAGARVRDLVVKQKQVYRGMAGQKYQATYDEAARLGVTENIDDVVAYTKQVLGADLNAYQQSEIPSVFRTVRDKFGKSAEKIQTDRYTGRPIRVSPEQGEKAAVVSFEELHSLYKRVNSDIASAAGSMAPDKDFKLLLLNQTKDLLGAKLAKFEDQGFGPVAEKFSEANRFYRDEYLPRFKQGFGGDVLARYGTGEHRVPNQKVVEMITKQNNAQAAKDFKLLFDDVPEAWQSLRDGYMDKLVRETNVLGTDGRINQKALDGFLRKHQQTLSEFPAVKNEFQQLALDNAGLLERQARVVAQQKALAAADMVKLFQGKPPAEVMTEAVTNPNVMRVLSHHARSDPRQANALARAIAEHVTAQADPAAFMAANRDTIRAGLNQLGKDHAKNVETAVEALTINRRNDLPTFVKSQGVNPDPIGEAFGSSPRAMIAHFLNVERGRSGPMQEGGAFLGRWFDKLRREHKAVAMEAVFYDKDAARAIASLSKNPASQKARVDWVNAMAGLGIRAEVAGQE